MKDKMVNKADLLHSVMELKFDTFFGNDDQII